MRIAHVLRRLSFDDWGGTEQVVWNLAKAQKAAGHDVRLFATTALWKGLVATKDTKVTKKALCSMCSLWQKNVSYEETIDGIKILRFRPIYPWWPMPKRLVDELDRKGGNPFVPGLGKALEEWQPDVIHCHAMARIAELCLRVGVQSSSSRKDEQIPLSRLRQGYGGQANSNSSIQLRSPIRRVVSLHGGGANVPGVEAKSLMAPTRRRIPWGKAIDIAMRWTRRVPEDFDGIVCVGEDEYLKYRERHPHVMFLPNGVDTSLFASSAPFHSSTLPPSHSSTTLLCVARIDRQKNQMALVEAVARHPDVSLRLVGPVTQPDYDAELKRRAEELGVAGRVAFVGALKPGSPELLAEYARADAFALASRHEPFGIVVLEAWAAGLPVVASDVGGLGKLCAAHPDAAITFSSDDADGLDRAIGELSRRISCGEAAAMSAAGRKAAQQYDWRTLSDRLIGFYGEI